MKNTLLILSLILFSLIWWAIWAYWLISYFPLQTITQDIEIIASNEQENTVIAEQVQHVDMVSLENTINETVKKIAPSVVSIVIKKDLVVYRSDPYGFFQQPAWTVSRQVWGWSWFFISKDGIILTNKHVVQDTTAEYTVILNTGEEYDATVVALDPVNDLAVIKIQDEANDFSPLPISQRLEDIEIGDFGIAVWNALAELQNSVSLWIVSGKNRTIQAWWDTLSGLLQTDAAINPGNSGGPLINLSWEVIGINTAIASNSNGIWFAYGLTQERVDYMLQSIWESGRIMRPFIGINYIPNSQWVASQLWLTTSQWVYIIDEEESILAGSSAEKAGLQPWDIILEVDGKILGVTTTLNNIIQNSLPWDILELKVLKKSWEEKNITLELWAF